jgi:transcriptional regulator with XRE-family HTH domain
MAIRKNDARKVLKKLGLKVRTLRNERGWTLEECEHHGFPNWKHLQTIEAGKNITVHTLVNLSNLFGVPISYLFDD